MSITLTGYRIKIRGGSNRPCEYKTVPLNGSETDTIAAIHADGYKGKICPQYSGRN